jgi:hypothetical protein
MSDSVAPQAEPPSPDLQEPVDLTDADRAALEETDTSATPVTYSGTDFDVEGLVRRLDRGDIVIPSFGKAENGLETAGFQRSFVWKRAQMERFIESLLLGYPIPGIMLVEQQDKRYLVLDGQQRLRTLSAFYTGLHNKVEFALQNVSDEFKDLTYKTLPPDLRRQLDNAFIQATIVKTDGSEASLDAVYQVFERLNSGGTQLTPHEIRVALYAGPFVDFLARLNDNASWRQLYGPVSPRLRDQELVLRAVAFYVSAATYRRPLKKFLNEFAGEHRMLQKLQHERIATLFNDASRALVDGPGRGVIRRGGTQVNAAFTESVYVGLMRRLEIGPVDTERLTEVMHGLDSDPDFGTSLVRATADEDSVRTRLAVASGRLSQI